MLAAVSMTVAALAVVPTAAVAAADDGGCHPSPVRIDSPQPISDLDGDAFTDPVVGVSRSGPGAVGAYLAVDASGGGTNVNPGNDFPNLNASPTFGSSISELDVDRDGCDDLVVGDPGHAGGGAVDLLYGGSQFGIDYARSGQIAARTAADRYGSAVAVDHYVRAGVGVTDLWIGAPGRTVGGLAGAGAVDHYTLDDTGTATFVESITENDSRLGGAAHVGAHFGAVLDTAAEHNGPAVLIGAPNDTVSGAVGAGAVAWLQVSTATGLVASAAVISQDTAGVPGAAESGDDFGAAIVASGTSIAVGVPGEDVGSLVDAGLVQTFTVGPTGALVAGPAWTQDSAGVPGTAEPGDQFGAAVTAGLAESTTFLWIGSPGEDLGSTSNAGDVTQVATSGGHRTYLLLFRGAGTALLGTRRTNAALGGSLGVAVGVHDIDGGGTDTLLIGSAGDRDFLALPADRSGGALDFDQQESTPDPLHFPVEIEGNYS